LIEVPLNRRIVQTLARVDRLQVPDLPDRIIAATALHLGVPLVSRDARIRASGVATVW
jgi:predicted nucleic acid-binding protein